MSQWTDETAQKVLTEVGRLSASDPEFRKLCFSNPKAAIEQVGKIALPANFVARFFDNQGANISMVLPDPVSSHELNEAELDTVAGGITVGGGTLPSGPMPFFKVMEPDFGKMTVDTTPDNNFLKIKGR